MGRDLILDFITEEHRCGLLLVYAVGSPVHLAGPWSYHIRLLTAILALSITFRVRVRVRVRVRKVLIISNHARHGL